MRSARRRVWLCSGYFVPPHQEREELARIARAGLDVRIIAPAFSDVQSAVFAARAAYGDLLEAGAHIYEMRDAVVHAKLAVVDDTWTVIGSSNLDRRSVVFNNEVDAVILGHDTAGQVEAPDAALHGRLPGGRSGAVAATLVASGRRSGRRGSGPGCDIDVMPPGVGNVTTRDPRRGDCENVESIVRDMTQVLPALDPSVLQTLDTPVSTALASPSETSGLVRR